MIRGLGKHEFLVRCMHFDMVPYLGLILGYGIV
jgi:hypothetical protein